MGWIVGVLGGLAGVTASVVTHPIDSLKVRMYLYGEGEANALPRLSIAKQIYQAEGPRAFFSGMTATCMRQSIFSSVRFATHDLIESQCRRWNGAEDSASTSAPTSLPQKLFAGAAAGALAAGVSCPADVVLVRMQADGRLPAHLKRNYRNVLHGLFIILTQEGPTCLFRGLGPLLTRACCLTATQFSAYDVGKDYLTTRWALDQTSIWTHLLASCLAGALATVVCNPLDMIKARMMQAKPGQYRSAVACAVALLRTEGARGLYKGLGPNLLRQCPQVMLMWVFYEQYAAWYKAGTRWYYAQTGTPAGEQASHAASKT
eukprot:EG_transcript_13393